MEPEDNRGPWEYLWHEILRCTTADRYSLFVYGRYRQCARMGYRRMRSLNLQTFLRNLNGNLWWLLARRGLLHAT